MVIQQDISWGTNTYFLKIEMDVTGGSTYSNMGTNQMMSVPYALYAESANINYDSISNLLSNDSTFITNVGGGMGGGGCDWQFPEGYDGEYLSFKLDASNSYSYIVPSGKRFYITNIYNFSTATNGYISINSNKIFKQINSNTSQYDLHSPYILNQGDLISVQSPNPYDCVLRGFLIDQTNNIIAITETPTNFGSPYIVPAGKKLVITNLLEM